MREGELDLESCQTIVHCFKTLCVYPSVCLLRLNLTKLNYSCAVVTILDKGENIDVGQLFIQLPKLLLLSQNSPRG